MTSQALAKKNNYCNDPAAHARWEQLVKKYPQDLEIQTLHAIWLGLCEKVKRKDISLDDAIKIFESARNTLIAKRTEENRRAEQKGVYGLVTKVSDGDTITIYLTGKQGQKVKVRLLGIDCPEKKQKPWGPKATAFTRKLVLNKIVRLETDVRSHDRYGRLLAYVWIENKMLNEELVLNGLCLLYTIPPNVRYSDRLKQALQEAKKNKAGFWAEGGLAITPAEFRRQN